MKEIVAFSALGGGSRVKVVVFAGQAARGKESDQIEQVAVDRPRHAK